MATLKEKMFYIKNGFKNGETTLDGKGSLLFLNDVLNELSSDPSNFNEFEDDIPNLYKACMEELSIAPKETKMILLSNVLKNSGINSEVKKDLSLNSPVFKKFLESKNPSDLYTEADSLLNHAVDEKNKIIEVDALISTGFSSLNKESDDSVLSIYVNNDSFDREKLTKVMAAMAVLKEFNEDNVYGLTENQLDSLDRMTLRVDKVKLEDQDFTDRLSKEIEHYRTFMFSNPLSVEAQIHELKKESELDGGVGFISSHPIEESLSDTLKNKNKRDAEDLDLSSVDWEKKYRDYLLSVNNIEVMSSGDKFKKRFGSHGFAPNTASLFGDSVVLLDKYGDPQRTLWNVSGLTGTMRLSRDIDYSDPNVVGQAFTIAALNARRNKWSTVYLNHPGPDAEAKQFLESSITAMVDIGNYSFDEIKVPRKFQHVLNHIKSNYTFIEDGNKLEAELAADAVSLDEVVKKPENDNQDQEIDSQEENKNKNKDGTDLSGFDGDNSMFDIEAETEAVNKNDSNNDYIGNEDNGYYEAPDIEDMDLTGYNPDGGRYERTDDFGLNINIPSMEDLNSGKVVADEEAGEKPTKKTTKKPKIF